MPRKILITPPADSISKTPYYIDVYDFSVIIPRLPSIEFLSVDGPMPEDAANEVVKTGKIGADVKEFFLSSRKERGVRADYWRVRVEDGKVISVEKTEKTFKEYDEMVDAALKQELKELAKAEKKAARKRR